MSALALNPYEDKDAFDDLTIASLMNSETSELQQYLIQRIAPMVYLQEADMEALVEDDPHWFSQPAWVFFLKFLRFYKPGSEGYNALKREEVVHVVNDIYKLYSKYLPLLD